MDDYWTLLFYVKTLGTLDVVLYRSATVEGECDRECLRAGREPVRTRNPVLSLMNLPLAGQ